LIKYVFLDIDDTIFDFKKSEKAALSEALSELGVEPTEETISLYSEINRGQWEALERGEVTREVLLIRRYEILFEKLGLEIDARRAQRLYERNLSRSYYFLPGAVELLNSLYGKYEIYFASNGTAIVQDGRISLSGIDEFASVIFISERVGHNKPSREFFEGCFEKIENFNRDEAIIIGDSLTSDILGGINAGIRTCLYNPKEKPTGNIKPDYEVTSLDEIPRLLERI